MIQFYNAQVNSPVAITTLISGTAVPGDLVLLKDGVSNSTPITFTSISASGLCKFTFTPTVTGIYTLYGQNSIIATVEVVAKSIATYLKNLEDEALGSWQWDKTAGVMTMVRQDGTQLAQFNVVDGLTASSRERI
jgi:hypothetical protein